MSAVTTAKATATGGRASRRFMRIPSTQHAQAPAPKPGPCAGHAPVLAGLRAGRRLMMQARPLCRAAVGGLRAAARAASGGDGGRQRQRPRGCSWPGPRRRRAAARARIPAGGPCPGGAHVTRPACARMMLWGVCGTGGAEFFFCVSAQMWHDACGWCAAEKKRWVGEREAHANPATPFPAHVPPLSPAAPPCSAPSPPPCAPSFFFLTSPSNSAANH